MAKTAVYWQRGESLDFINETEEIIPAGAVVSFGNRIGVAGTEIHPGEKGSLHMVGVFEIPKKSNVALTAGDPVTFTDEDGIDKASAESIGYAVETVAADADTVRVKLMG